ncbi:MAG: peptidyl-prolyl cis-trans isomerase B (cyclophilin B) [Parcubacteria group bacterium Gr01-1014_70]|nr:MAG: peptidyl-prolyl cis-trans isomerase B (cyclophilin B) [Parcubacteria group bacterium Gr01-1014_70]
MKTLITYIVIIGIIAAVIFLLSQQGVSFVPEEEKQTDTDGPGTVTLDKATLADIETSFGTVTVQLFPEDAPKTVENFVKLATSGFYNGTSFHRVIKGFMIQGGDPNSKDDDWSDDGQGGPGYSFDDEINTHKLVRGALAMANSGPNTNGSQFFIVTAADTPWLDGKHTVFGRVVGGMEVVDTIEAANTNENDHPLENITVQRITVSQ